MGEEIEVSPLEMTPTFGGRREAFFFFVERPVEFRKRVLNTLLRVGQSARNMHEWASSRRRGKVEDCASNRFATVTQNPTHRRP